MSFISLGLMLFAVAVIYGLFYAGYRLFRSAKLDDEEAERQLRQEEADRAAAIAAKYPGQSTKDNKDKLKKLLDRSL